MNNHYHHLVFGQRSAVRQQRDGGWTAYGRQTERADDGPEALDTREKAIIRGVDQFHIGTVTEAGWPYVQYRSGPKGFLQVLDDHTLGFADFRGNSQYVTASNLDNDDRVTLFIADYPNRQRIKLFGRAHTVEADEDPELMERLRMIGSIQVAAKCERSVLIRIEAFDWNCTRSIIPRFDKQYLAELSDVYRRKADEREQELLGEIAALKAQLHDARGHRQH